MKNNINVISKPAVSQCRPRLTNSSKLDWIRLVVISTQAARSVISTKAVGRMEKSASRRSFDSALRASLKMTVRHRSLKMTGNPVLSTQASHSVISTKAVGRMEKSASRRSFDSALREKRAKSPLGCLSNPFLVLKMTMKHRSLKMTGNPVLSTQASHSVISTEARSAKWRNLIPAAALCLLAVACTGRFESINTNPNQVTKDQMGAYNYAVGAKVISLQALVVPAQEHQYQFIESLSGGPFGGYFGSVDKWGERWETFNPSNAWRSTPFKDVMTNLYTPYRGILNDASDDEVAVAFANLFRVAVMHRMCDTYGPIPYSDVLNTEEAVVAYDSQQAVYTKMFEELDAVAEAFASNLNVPAAQWSSYDKVYYGNIPQWLKYTNSLRLRMATRLRYVDEVTYRTQAAKAIEGGLILTNADNAYYHTGDNRIAIIQSWNDHRVGADIICYMNGYEDPRREKMFIKNLVPAKITDSSPIGPEEDRKYVGVRIGFNSNKASDFSYNYSNWQVTSSDPILWMNAAEVNFLLAEYELAVSGDASTAKDYYENGIRLSFEEHGVAGAEEYIRSDGKPEKYTDPLGIYSYERPMSECQVRWDSAGDDEAHLEQIITQKWLAIFPLGNEAWAEYRRTGYPKLLPAPHNLGPYNIDLNHHARRLIYPVEEYEQNGANVRAAVTMLAEENGANSGYGDSMASRVWWDCKVWL